ncbi:MAG: RNA 2',3'-cyclic phosphodiesterase [Armatimonadetes bacterium]|nr:RNA 2',3'-cyclic phosphodiesterase [Armatimonadota bacterium]
MKLFFALDLSPIARNALSEYVPKVQTKLDRQGLKWVSAEKWHVTLVFLGDEDVEAVRELAAQALTGAKEVRLRVGSIDSFPDHKRPGVLWLGVESVKGDLNALYEALSAVLPGDREGFVPHITLGRMKPASTKLGHRLRDFMHSGAKPEDIEWTVESVTLFNTKPDGAYEVVAEFPLQR